MRNRISFLVAPALLAAAFGANAATETLSFDGAPFDFGGSNPANLTSLPGGLPVANTGDVLTGSVVLGTALGQNGEFVVTPLSYTFSLDGKVVISGKSSAPSANQGASFDFTTTNGVVTDFDVALSLVKTKGTATTALGITLSSTQGDVYEAEYSKGIISDLTEGVSSGGGTWTVKGGGIAAPEMDPSSALAALTLLAGGVLVLRGRRSMVPRAGIEPAT